MTTAVLLVIGLSAVVVTAALVSTLLAIRRATLRAEMLLTILEREVRPMTSQLQSLVEELRGLSQHADQNMERMGAVIRRVDDVTTGIARVVGFVGGMTRVGQLVGTATGVKKGLDVFIAKLISKNKKHDPRRTTNG